MNDHDKFDDYIKGLFDKEPEVPAELNWEEMDFDLPDTSEQNSKPDRKKYLGLLLLLLIAIAVVYFSVEKEKIAEHQRPTETVEQPTENKTESNTNPHTTGDYVQTTSILDDSQRDIKLSDEKIISNPTIHTIKPKNQTASKPKNTQEKTSPLMANTSLYAVPDNNTQLNTINSKDDFLRSFSNDNTPKITTQTNTTTNYKSTETPPSSSPIIETKTVQESTQSNIETLSAILINTLPINNEVELLPSPALAEMNYKDKASGFRLEEVFAGYGLNNFNLKVEASNILKDKVKSDTISSSIRVGARFHLNNNWRTNIQLKYDRYHSNFEHTGLDTTFYRSDGNRLYRVHRYEEIFHNNYTNTLGIQLGVERKWQVAKRLHLYAGLGITPTYTLSVDGKTTADMDVDSLIFDNEVSRFAMNGNLSAGVIIPINKSINIEAAYQYNRFLLNNIFINNGIQTNQQNNVSLIISYRLSK